MIRNIIVVFIVFQSLNGWSQDLKNRIKGNWEMLQYNLSEDIDEDEEISTETIWVFKNDNICEERIDPDDPTKKIVYNYIISQENCQTKMLTEGLYYLWLTNKTIPGDDYCFLISSISSVNEMDKSERLSLFSHGALSPNVLVRR
ncbi:MAG: hypothetical protein V4572_12145 [Bacteroidota bacterium]